jgi:hypothetical protein
VAFKINYNGAVSRQTSTDANGNFTITLGSVVVGRFISFIALDSQQLQGRGKHPYRSPNSRQG